ncbi:hypothetical protein CROQUDRAFT_653512 [Cronartium quercuum f. sp. fusiforme G11]|uniref:Zn(2)-C6 fungal-type domain-containing protein n=1 Tax=Cronartium quercuum f. sp. fusiforme G11 TaxID=708437 RepID=A0A9P6NSV5_9BASI|nr:hypothetical protein CROQUDRAFT_653512 [Cronartium quercuum f. sp. fusiforme G11]
MAVPAPPLQAERSKARKTHKATCAGCRRRRTRCDRLLPCSECKKRGVECDYTGAIPPSRSVRSCRNDLDEREQYIKQLEARLEALEQAKLVSSLNSTKDVPAVQIDFSSDDLACHLSRLTLSPRLQHCPLEGHLAALFSNWTSQPASAVFLPHNAFQMSIIPTSPPPPLDALQACLPPLPELAELAGYYFDNFNTTCPFVFALERSAWPDAVARCYKPSDVHQFTPEDFHRLAVVFCVAAHGAIQKDVLATPNSQCAQAHKWFHIALGVLTQPDRGAILTQTTIWSIRAMALLAQVPLAPDNLDQGIIFWTLLMHLARSVGLFNEPPQRNAEQVGDVELESRRNLAWSILQLDVTGETIAGATWKPMDFEFHGLLLPGTVNCKIDPNDGWPVDLFLAVCRALALMNRVASELITKISGGRIVSYDV